MKRRSTFVKVRCPDCGGEQIAFDRPASVVACLVCGSVLARPTGGEGRFKGEVVSRLE